MSFNNPFHPHPFLSGNIVYGNRVFDLNSFFNERAGPRRRPFTSWRSTALPSIIRDNIQAPHYARVHNIYPEFMHSTPVGTSPSAQSHSSSTSDDQYRYIPPSARLPSTASSSSATDQITEIPVVHMVKSQDNRRVGPSFSGNNHSTVRATLSNGGSLSSISSAWSSDSASVPRGTITASVSYSSTPIGRTSSPPTASTDSVSASSSSVNISSGRHSNSAVVELSSTLTHQRHNSSSSTSSSTSTTPANRGNDPTEAEVDALTSRLIRKLSAGAIEGPFTPTADGTNSLPSSPTSPSSGQNPQQRDSPYSFRTKKVLLSQDPDSCYRCLRPLDPKHSDTVKCMALRVYFHKHCFHCFKCDKSLPVDDYYLANNRILCAECVQTSLEKCYACDEEIKERVIRGLGHPYHPKCFTCAVCGRCLDGSAFTFDIHKRIHCLEDFHKRYGPRCASCGLPITPLSGRQETKRVVTKNLSYHLECFNVVKHSP